MSELKQLINSAEEMIKDEESPEKVLNALLTDLKAYEKFNGWIPVSERLPEEHESIFMKYKGTDKWKIGMFEKCSDKVKVTIEFEDGTRITKTLHTIDGNWERFFNGKVIAWQPLPEPWKGVDR